MNRHLERQKYLEKMDNLMLHKRIEKDQALIMRLKSDLSLLIWGITSAKADIPPYLKQVAKDIEKRWQSENNS